MLNLRDILRSGHVTRWHSVRNLRAQTLAEHHYMVTMIARFLARKVYGSKLTDTEMNLLVDYCLHHDLPEILTGDISSPCKRRLELNTTGSNPLTMLEYEIYPPLEGLASRLHGTPLAYIAKLADLADAIVYIRQEGSGNDAIRIAQSMLDDFTTVLSTMFDITDEQQSLLNLSLKKRSYSTTHAIEKKLIHSYHEKVTLASASFKDLNWAEAINVLNTLLDGDDATLLFEY